MHRQAWSWSWPCMALVMASRGSCMALIKDGYVRLKLSGDCNTSQSGAGFATSPSYPCAKSQPKMRMIEPSSNSCPWLLYSLNAECTPVCRRRWRHLRSSVPPSLVTFWGQVGLSSANSNANLNPGRAAFRLVSQRREYYPGASILISRYTAISLKPHAFVLGIALPIYWPQPSP